jgi:hypothetical protein
LAAPDSQDQFRTKTNKLLISKLVKEDVVAPRQQQTELVPSVDPLFYEPGIEMLEVSGRVRASLCSRQTVGDLLVFFDFNDKDAVALRDKKFRTEFASFRVLALPSVFY